ncbi:esterase/lipase family protein [Chromobacterium sp.]|uniref:esterase/lipase family protein n=1 Tax=Chromobacterium sp. TaxID=306190 RepID=UPI0035B1C7CA
MTDDRKISPQYDRDGKPYWSSITSKPNDSFAICTIDPDRVIPVIFVPGVMGSNLICTQGKGKGIKWLLNDTGSMLPWLGRGAQIRRESLDPAVMQVFQGGKVSSRTPLNNKLLKERGWGEVGYMSYGEYLADLHLALNDFHCGGWNYSPRKMLIGKDLKAEKGEVSLKEDEVALSYRYAFPIYACGYNWLDDNASSAKLLKNRIQKAISDQKKLGHKCEKVIVVTHSMGGLVARYCSEVLGMRDQILGVVHGVMPAIGAAAVYRRMKAGTENGGKGQGTTKRIEGAVASEILGGNGLEMTSVLSQSPGPLQLLPTPEYGNNWLKIEVNEDRFSFPKSGDPYREIYTVRGKWWSLCEDHLIDPSNIKNDPAAKERNWERFKTVIQIVKGFHTSISKQYHANTHAFYGSSEEHLSFGNVTWNGESAWGEELLSGKRKGDVLNARALDPTEIGETRTVATPVSGGWKTGKHQAYTFANQDEPGDGTVPHRSGYAPYSSAKTMMRVSTEHEPAYRDCQPAQQFTLRAIVHITQAIKQTALAYSE